MAVTLPLGFQPPGFRFWIDEVLWSQGRAAVELMEEVLLEAGGSRTGGPTRAQLGGRWGFKVQVIVPRSRVSASHEPGLCCIGDGGAAGGGGGARQATCAQLGCRWGKGF